MYTSKFDESPMEKYEVKVKMMRAEKAKKNLFDCIFFI